MAAELLMEDTFTDADNVTWANHTPEKGAWSVTPAATPAKILNNKLVGATAFGSDIGIYDVGISNNLYAAIDGFPGTSGQLMFLFRYASPTDYWMVGLNGANMMVRNPVRGTLNTQATGINPVSMHNLYFSVVGSVVTFSWESGGPLTYTITGSNQNLDSRLCGLLIYNLGSGAVDRYRVGFQSINPYAGGGLTLEEDWRTAAPDTYTLTDHASVTNPVLTKTFVTDLPNMGDAGSFVADPFIVKEGVIWYLFFEGYNGSANTCVASSPDGLNWTYISKTTPNLGSYPFVFKVDGQWWLIHDGGPDISLYRPLSFPTTWEQYEIIAINTTKTYRDVSLFQWNGYFYVLAGDVSGDTLRLFFSSTLTRGGGVYSEHPASPILSGVRNFRPGGRPVVHPGDGIDIFVQDSVIVYGNKVRAYRISALSPAAITITEKAESPILDGDGSGWNATGMHNLDRVDSTYSVVDGNASGVWAIGIYKDAP